MQRAAAPGSSTCRATAAVTGAAAAAAVTGAAAAAVTGAAAAAATGAATGAAAARAGAAGAGAEVGVATTTISPSFRKRLRTLSPTRPCVAGTPRRLPATTSSPSVACAKVQRGRRGLQKEARVSVQPRLCPRARAPSSLLKAPGSLRCFPVEAAGDVGQSIHSQVPAQTRQ